MEGKLFVLPPGLGYTCQGRSLVHPETPRVELVDVTAKVSERIPARPFGLKLKLVLQESPLRVEVAPHALVIILQLKNTLSASHPPPPKLLGPERSSYTICWQMQTSSSGQYGHKQPKASKGVASPPAQDIPFFTIAPKRQRRGPQREQQRQAQGQGQGWPQRQGYRERQ